MGLSEVWKDIEGYEGRYQVSDCGRVKTVERHKSDGRKQPESIRITQVDRRGYEFVILFDGEKYHRFSVHVLVARAFIPNNENKPQVNHIDGDKLNNVAENLEWATASENIVHALKTGLLVPKHGDERKHTKVRDADIRNIRERRKRGETLQSIADAFGLSMGYVGRVVRGERRTYS